MSWRYYAMNILTREWLHRDLPLTDVDISLTLNGPTTIRASIDSTWSDLFDSKGSPLLKEWNALILAEKDGIIRAGGILINSDFQGAKWSLDIKGFMAYPQGQILERDYKFNENGAVADGQDPITVFKWLWTDGLGYFPDANLGITFNGVQSDYRLGTWEYYEYGTKKVKGKTTKTRTKKTKEINGVNVKRPSNIIRAYYYLYAYDNVDVGQKMSELAKQTPFDFAESYSWSDSTKNDVTLKANLGYPRLGGKRDMLRFVEGENVTEVIPVKTSGDGYSNAVRMIGAGEGKDQKSVTVSDRDGRLRRMTAITDQTLKTDASLKSVGKSILNTRKNLVDIQSVTVIDHPNARIGSFGVGDDIYIQTHIGWQKVGLWVRITEYSFSPDSGTVTLTTTRSDSFRYVSESE